jgi:hypothetical protein
VRDPISQKAFVWNRNNPYTYSDPSGYCPDGCVLEAAATIGTAEVLVGALAIGSVGLAGVGLQGQARGAADAATAIQGAINRAVAAAVDEARRHIPTSVREQVKGEKGTNCIYCGTETRPEAGHPNSHELDHNIPVSRGGTNDPDNLDPTCRTCNREKGSKTGEEYRPHD